MKILLIVFIVKFLTNLTLRHVVCSRAASYGIRLRNS